MDSADLAPASWVVAAGRPQGPGAPSNAPMVPASTFEHGDPRLYARADATPGWEAFEEVVGGLEGGVALAWASGMAAVAAVFDQVPTGGRVAIPDDSYQGVAMLADRGAALGRWEVTRIPTAATDAWIEASATSALLWLESPSNPLLAIADVPAICAAPRADGCLVAVDNTFATPLNQRPLRAGADVVVHSATKFLGGHSDLLAGVAVTADAGLEERLRTSRTLSGATPGTLEVFLALRGTRTLALRLAAAQRSAAVLAHRLADHPAVDRVRWPGLPDHPGHEVAARTLDGFGTMLSFDVAGGAGRATALCEAVRLVRHATSLGGVESSVERRGGLPGQEHLPPSLLRLSVGCEDVEDLWRDLDQALAATT
jgi:cystathionine gamma-synthase